MNERIQELAREAGFYANPDVEKFEKFAELIVKECTDIANGTRYDGKVVANRIKFVFGVEE